MFVFNYIILLLTGDVLEMNVLYSVISTMCKDILEEKIYNK